jgi:PAS domain S-box-containing protein
MFDFLSHLFDTAGFPPRWKCGDWTPGHGWLHVLSDLAIWSAYFAIPCILAYFVLRRKDIPFRPIFWLFGAFILACGTTHLMEAIIFWHPLYRLAGVIKLLTALVSWGTVVALVPTIPKALAMRTPDELEREIATRKQAEDALERANADLETRVQERTAELAQANASLRESQWREKQRADELEAILRATPTPIWTAHDPECHLITGNPASFTLLGLPEGANVSATSPDHDPSKRGFREYRGDTPIPPNELPLQRAARGELVNGAEVKFVFDDGRVRYIYGNAVPLRNPDGSVRGCVAAFADVTSLKEVTERKQAEEALRQSEERFRQLAENINEVFWMTDPQTTQLLYISPAYERVWGRSRQSLYENPRSFMDAIHSEDRECVRIAVLENRSRGEQTDKEYRVVRPDGSIRWVRDRAFPVKNAAGQFYRLVGIIDDFTARKNAEEALKETDRRKDEFLAMLAHELRNPLAPIRTGLDRMRLKAPPGSDLHPILDVVERQLGQMTRLVDDLLDVSRITRGQITLHKERVDLHAVFTQAVETARPLIDARQHDLTYTPAPEPLLLDADPTRLAQALSNVLGNAAKYTEKGGLIWLAAERDNGEAVVRVQDNGIGIDPAMLLSVFDLFTQAHPAQGRSQGGLGIGLAVAKRLVEMHGGSVTAHSAGAGQGSEFVFRLPLLSEHDGDQTKGVRAGAGTPSGQAASRRILVVDDLVVVAESMAALVREAFGHEVRTAHDGPSALRVADDFRPELVLLDIGMPGMDGYEVARRLRQQSGMGHAVLVALTGWGQEEDRRKSKEAGFDHHVVKPMGLKQLQSLLAGLKQAEGGDEGH